MLIRDADHLAEVMATSDRGKDKPYDGMGWFPSPVALVDGPLEGRTMIINLDIMRSNWRVVGDDDVAYCYDIGGQYRGVW